MKKTAKAAVILLLTIMVLIVSCGEDPFFHYLTVRNDEGKTVTTIVVSGGDYTLPDKVEGLEDIEGWIYEDKEYAVGEVIKVTKDSEITAVTGTVIMVDNGNGTTQKVVVKKGQTTLTLPKAPAERTGYVFDGWLVNGKLKEASESVEYTEGMTIKAVWTKLISITVNNGDGTTQTVNVREDAKEITLPEAPAERTGFDFDGWLVNGKLKEASASVEYTEGMTIEAKWTVVYTITYNANEGTGSVEAGKLREDNTEGIEIASGTPLSNGSLSFSGWNTQADGNGTAYAPGAVYKTKADLTLYAIWIDEITVTYYNGTTKVDTVTGKPAELTLMDASTLSHADGTEFDAWYTNSDFTGECYSENQAFTKSVTLYAHFVDSNLDYSIGGAVTVKSTSKTSITSATVPSVYKGTPITMIAASGFRNCKSLTKVELPSSLTMISDYAFAGCSKLTSLTLPDGLISIGTSSFEECGVTSIEIPSSVTTLGTYTFYKAGSLKTVEFKGAINSIPASMFSTCGSLESVTLSEGLTSISGNAFNSCSSLKSIKIPESVTSIADTAFSSCNNLKTIIMAVTKADAAAVGLATDKTWGATNSKVVWSYKAGDTVQRGTYPSSYEVQSLRGGAVNWKVLYVDSANSRMLVISEKILDLKQFDDGNATSYEDADVLDSLNTIYSSYSLNSCSDILDVDADGNVGSGSSYKYKLFLLSEAEVNTYFGTDSKIAYYDADTGWWLRTFNGSEAGYVNTSGEIASYSVTSDLGIRPAMWISLSN